MIDEALEVFRKIYDKEREELVVSKHIPKDGTYILVNIKSGRIMETLNISYDKKTKKLLWWKKGKKWIINSAAYNCRNNESDGRRQNFK